MWLLLAGCVIILLSKIIVDWSRSKLKVYPPGPRGLPIIGNLLQVNRLVKETGFHFGALAKLAEVYGPILRLRFGLAKPIVVVSGREAVLDFLGRREFDGRPDTFEIRYRCLGKKRGIVLNDGQDWSEQKRFALKVLKDFGFGKQTMETLVLEDARMLGDIIKDGMLDRRVDVHELCESTAIAVISSLWNLIAGRRCDPTKEETGMLEILRILKESFRSGSVTGSLWQHIPVLRYIMPKYSGFADQKQRVATMSNYFLEEVARHKESKVSGEPRDLIDKYLDEIESASDDHDKPSCFDELQLVVLLKDIFSAGIETTSNTIGFTVAYLSKHPRSQSKIHRELDRVIGPSGLPRLAHKNSLSYLNATIAEVLRLANVTPTTVVHRALADCSLLGYSVEKNWSVIGNLRSVHMDPEHWLDATEFRPERFIDATGKFIEDPWLMPFGAGRRKCLGENLARTSLFLFLARLLQKFRFELAPGESAPCLLGVNGFTVSPPHIGVVIRSRCHDNAEEESVA
ncbi:methyl farnesoate epoxidase-like [Copidosoma floridanum]|uniref:methyl farnesoate epoxidase-like n=1 Tax=Copidosoma floridanum TaxID=29053 RepID=UPI0006C98AD7|nr:methyl farnesoate epoxidase-like [Copidosoma floridanum]